MIDILVPVLGRGHQAQPLVDNIAQASSYEHRVLFICSPFDEATTDACRATGCDVLVTSWKPGRADFARKINLAWEQTDAEWVFQAATDLRFHPRWDAHAVGMHTKTRCRVVGTNDLGNPLVQRGRHSTHTLIRRDYITDFGSGTLDNSGLVFSLAYDHQWTDNDFVETARMRREFVFAKRSIVEHMHPHWGKGDDDATYKKAMRQTTRDRALFSQRMRDLIRPAAR